MARRFAGGDRKSGSATLGELAVAAREGRAKAAEELYERAYRHLVIVARALGAPPDEVCDLVQEVLLASWRRLDRYDPSRGSFIGWLIPGLRGRASNLGRAGRRRERFLSRFCVTASGSWEESSDPRPRLEARLTLAALLGSLTSRQRQVLTLYDLGGLSSRAVADVLHIAPAAVRSIARDARRRLKLEAKRRMRIASERLRMQPSPGCASM